MSFKNEERDKAAETNQEERRQLIKDLSEKLAGRRYKNSASLIMGLRKGEEGLLDWLAEIFCKPNMSMGETWPGLDEKIFYELSHEIDILEENEALLEKIIIHALVVD